jgi:hypothetical protein
MGVELVNDVRDPLIRWLQGLDPEAARRALSDVPSAVSAAR